MKIEEIEKEFEQIAKKSQSLFIRPVKVAKEITPTGDINRFSGKVNVPATEDGKPLLPLLDPNLDLISKMTRLLYAHDVIKENIYKYQTEQTTYLFIDNDIEIDPIIEILQELSIIDNFNIILDKLNILLESVYTPGKIKRLSRVEINTYNKNHPTTFLIEINNILQKLHSEAIDILSEYNILSGQYQDILGIDKTKILFFNIGNNVRIANIEPYNIPIDIINFINVFIEEVEKTGYNTYMNILYIPTDKKYRMDLTLGGIFAHRSIIIYDPDPSQLYFEHIYADANYSRTLAWQMCLAEFSKESSKAKIDILEGERIPEEKSLAWRFTLMKVRIEKEFLSSMAIIIYLINWDNIINDQDENVDIMYPEKEAEIIYLYGIHPKYDEKEKRYTVEYDIRTQNVMRGVIRYTIDGIKDRLLDTDYYKE